MSFRVSTDLDILLCRLQSLEKWSSSQNPLDICLGEKTAYSPSDTEIASHQQSKMIGKAALTLDVESTGRREGWTECFQDLGTWCPPRLDELNTPQVTANTECFNFGTIDQVRCLEDLYSADLMSETLTDDFACMGPTYIGFDEDDNNNNTNNDNSYCNTTTPHLKSAQTSATDSQKPIQFSQTFKSTSGNVLPSQTHNFDEPTAQTAHSSEVMNLFTFHADEDDEDNFLSVPPDRVSRRRRDFQIPETVVKKERPQLGQLDVVSLPTTAVAMPSTPEVQNVLNDPNLGFDLIKYVVSADYVNGGSGSALLSKSCESVERDHDYSDPTVRSDVADSPPADTPPLVVIKAEPLSPAASSKLLTSRVNCPAKRARSNNTSEFALDSDVGSSDGSEDWEPSSAAAKRFKTKRSRSVKTARADSDAESVASSLTTDRYRELRDKNNEASRRSRLNRKQRDSEMKTASDQLEMENRALRAKATRMQKLVLDMREIIMKTIKGARN